MIFLPYNWSSNGGKHNAPVSNLTGGTKTGGRSPEEITNRKLFLVPGGLTDFVTGGDIISKCIAHQYFLIDKPSNQELTAIEKIES